MLQLDGAGDYLELPPTLFDGLTETTIEGWVKWDALESGKNSRWIDFGREGQRIEIGVAQDPPVLYLSLQDPAGTRRTLVGNAVGEGQWHHLALVVDAGSARLHLDGVLAGTNSFAGGLPESKNNATNRVGTRVLPKERWAVDFNGCVDELRVWKTARTDSQIRDSLFATFTGAEPDLAGWWRFDDGSARDATPNGRHGKFMDNARCIAANLPRAAEHPQPGVIFGKISNEQGESVPWSKINLEIGGAVVTSMYSDPTGAYAFLAYPTNAPYDLSASRGELSASRGDLEVKPDSRVPADLKLLPNISLSGQIRTLINNAPYAAVPVQAVPLQGPNPEGNKAKKRAAPAAPEPVITLTDSQGRFRFIDLKPGQYKLRCHGWDDWLDFDTGRALNVEPDQPAPAIEFRVPEFKATAWQRFGADAGLPSGMVRCITANSGGSLWLGTGEGCWHFQNGRATAVGLQGDPISGPIAALFTDPRGRSWFGGPTGLSSYDPRHPAQPWRSFTVSDELHNNSITAIGADATGTPVVGTDFGLARFDGKTFRPMVLSNGPPITFVSALAAAPGGSLWCGTFGNGAFRFDSPGWTRFGRTNGLPDEKIYCIQPDPRGGVWLGTGRGAVRLDGTNVQTFARQQGLAGKTIFAIHHDAAGATWFGTSEGLTRYSGQAFVNWTPADGLPHAEVLAIADAGLGRLWLGTAGGLCRFDRLHAPMDPVAKVAGSIRTDAGGSAGPAPTRPASASRQPQHRRETAPILKLEPRWQPGTRYVYRLDFTENNAYTYGRNSTLWQEQSVGALTFALAARNSTEPAGVALEFQLLALERLQKGGDQVWLDFDSKGDADPKAKDDPMSAALRRMTGPRLTLRLDPARKGVQIDGYEAFIRVAASNSPPWVAADLKRLCSEALLQQIADYRSWVPATARPATTSFGKATFPLIANDTTVFDLAITCAGSETRDQRRCVRFQLAGTVDLAATPKPSGGDWPLTAARTASTLWFDPRLGVLTELRLDQRLAAAPAEASAQGFGETSREATLKLVAVGNTLPASR